MRKKLKGNKGITLVALVITIVVLLILAGVVVGTLSSNGIIEKAKDAKIKYEESHENEQEIVNNINDFTENPFSRLPNEYKEVEYLQSSGKQKIDTKEAVSNSTKVILKFAINDYTKGNAFFGNYSTNSYGILLGINSQGLKQAMNGLANWKNLVNMNDNEFHNIECSNNGVYLDNEKVLNLSGLNSSGTSTMWAFGTSTGFNFEGGFCKISELKIYNGENLVKNFVPCYCKTSVIDINGNKCEKNTAGMFDIVNNQFYTNQGSEEFECGPDVNIFTSE